MAQKLSRDQRRKAKIKARAARQAPKKEEKAPEVEEPPKPWQLDTGRDAKQSNAPSQKPGKLPKPHLKKWFSH